MKIPSIFKSRPLLSFSVILGVIVFFVLQQIFQINSLTAYLLALNTTQICFLILFVFMVLFSSEQNMRLVALKEDDGRKLIVFLTLLVTIGTFVGVVHELRAVRLSEDKIFNYHLLLAVVTVTSSWLFSHTMFAVHYAHKYYTILQHTKKNPLQFPQTDKPNYFDFLYFSFVIGTSAQTADVNFADQKLRRLGLLHCVFAFVFNTFILALTINIGASLL